MTKRIRITRAFRLIDEIPFKPMYYPTCATPEEAVELEKQRPLKFKMQEFADLLDSTPETSTKFKMKEIIEVIDDES